ncbi:class I SAM-dependent methyltransferase, partial [Candidatus Falkowbacteria bacterium]|nr:class I SAM-dependent methyltransferase [Candidatus Falkowbacteria bacterium]
MNREESLAIVAKVNDTYNTIAPHFSLTRYKLWGDFDYFKPYINSGQEILDAGCGNGRLIEFFSSLHVQYTGFDSSSELIAQAEQKAKT